MSLYIAAILAFVPTLILMYAVLRKYTFPAVAQPFFSDPSFFGLFTVGLIAGTLLFTFFTYLNWSNTVYAILFAVILCLASVVILNLKRYHGKSDTVFYGYGLGLGLGCTLALGWIYYMGQIATGVDENVVLGVTDYLIMFIYAVSQIFVMSAVGTTVGEGVARLRPMEYTVKAMMYAVVAYALLSLSGNYTDNGILFYVFLAAMLIYSAGLFVYVIKIKLSGVVRDVLKMEGNNRKDVPR